MFGKITEHFPSSFLGFMGLVAQSWPSYADIEPPSDARTTRITFSMPNRCPSFKSTVWTIIFTLRIQQVLWHKQWNKMQDMLLLLASWKDVTGKDGWKVRNIDNVLMVEKLTKDMVGHILGRPPGALAPPNLATAYLLLVFGLYKPEYIKPRFGTWTWTWLRGDIRTGHVYIVWDPDYSYFWDFGDDEDFVSESTMWTRIPPVDTDNRSGTRKPCTPMEHRLDTKKLPMGGKVPKNFLWRIGFEPLAFQ